MHMASIMCLFPCSSILHYKNPVASTRGLEVCKPILCSSSQSKSMVVSTDEDESLIRRSANYAPPLWSFDDVQSLSSKYTGEDYEARADSLKKAVKTMVQKVETGKPLKSLELVDNLQRLGISYHFEEEIRQVLEMIYNDHYKTEEQWNGMDMNLKALGFRLLRQHGHHVPQEIFLNFKHKISTQNVEGDKDHVVGMLNLYEACSHSLEDESILDDARDFTTKFLKKSVEEIDGSSSSSSSLWSLISHALELPLHWRVGRLEAKWFIETYKETMNPTLMELAILDFNMVQAINLQDLKHSSRWWKITCWDKKLSFSRDRLVEGYMWTIGVWHLPNFSLGRITLTKVNAIITAIDDIYDIYGTLDELQRFTHVIIRWDINAVEELPDYMKICFLGSYNVINEMAYNTLVNTGVSILPYLKKGWADICSSYLLEAQWYQSGYIPTLEEYLANASVSISVPVGLLHCNFLTYNFTSNQEIEQYMEKSANIIHYSALILRLADDLGTSSDEMARGDNPKSIQCYMHDTGATEDEARSYMKTLMFKTWKKLNKERAGAAATCQYLLEFECAANLARMAPFMYSEGDGYGSPELAKSKILSLLFNPIQSKP